MGPDPAVAAVRLAVRRTLAAVDTGGLVLVACSGGADSLALAGALAFEAAGSGHRAGGITVDHGLQEGSADRAAGVVRTLTGLGLAPSEAETVAVGSAGGPEAAAREARYAALERSPRATEPTPYSSATPATTRPKRCCWASRAAPARGRWRAWPP